MFFFKNKKSQKKPLNREANIYGLNAGSFYIEENFTLPENYKEYCFYPYDLDRDTEFINISLKIMNDLFENYRVITHVSALYSPEGNNYDCWWNSCFPYKHYKFLIAYELTQNVIFDGQKDLFTVTNGIDVPLTKSLISGETSEFEGNWYSVYGYSKFDFDCKTIQDIETLISAHSFDLYIEYHETHDYLSLIINIKNVDINAVSGTIQDICEFYGKTLEKSF